MSRRHESELLAAGEPVVRVPTKLTAGAKSDPIDAVSVARAALHDLICPELRRPAQEIKLSSDNRESLIRERTLNRTGSGGDSTSSNPAFTLHQGRCRDTGPWMPP